MLSFSIPISIHHSCAYHVEIQENLLQNLTSILDPFQPSSVMIVSDENVARHYQSMMAHQLPQAHWTIIPPGETSKTLVYATQLYEQFCHVGLDRKSMVMALGGGVVGDLAGFAAATYLRGIRLVQIPTSLLAMVDSSVGGKVAVDLPQGKNLVGAFKTPEAVWIDPTVLETLPIREWRCGMAEVIKHGLLANESLLEISTPQDLTLERLAAAIQVKADIVQRDPWEDNIREHLNLGHTYAHALEQSQGYQLRHGEAVAIGLVAAARLSWKLGLCRHALTQRIQQTLEKLGLPTSLPSFDPNLCWQAMTKDKKWQAGKARLVLLRDIGHIVIQENISQDMILEALHEVYKEE